MEAMIDGAAKLRGEGQMSKGGGSAVGILTALGIGLAILTKPYWKDESAATTPAPQQVAATENSLADGGSSDGAAELTNDQPVETPVPQPAQALTREGMLQDLAIEVQISCNGGETPLFGCLFSGEMKVRDTRGESVYAGGNALYAAANDGNGMAMGGSRVLSVNPHGPFTITSVNMRSDPFARLQARVLVQGKPVYTAVESNGLFRVSDTDIQTSDLVDGTQALD